MNEAEQLRISIAQRNSRLEIQRSQLARLEKDCIHFWVDTKYIPDYTPGHTIDGDAPGTMGVDHRDSYFVPAKTTKKWSRKCTLCGVIQVTTSTKKIRGSGDIPGTSSEVEVPDFGGES